MATPRSNIKNMLGSAEEQRELFLLKFPDIERVDITDMFEAFKKYDKSGTGSLDEHSIQLMMADLGVHKTLAELRALLSAIDFSQGKKVQFMELCCASFGKSFADIEKHEDPVAMAHAKQAAEAAQRVEDEINKVREDEAAKAKELHEQLEKESQMTGVAGMKAFFARAASSTPDQTMSNAERIKQEAAFRKAKKEAEATVAAAEAEMKLKNKSDEDIAKEVAAMAKKLQDDADSAAQAAVEQERAERAARRAAFQSKFEGK